MIQIDSSDWTILDLSKDLSWASAHGGVSAKARSVSHLAQISKANTWRKWSSIYRSTARLNHSLHLKKLLQCSTIYHCSINVHPNSIQWAPSHKSCSKDTAFNDWAAPSCERREMLGRLSISSLQQPKLPIVYGAVLIALPRIDDKNFFFLLRGSKLLRNTKGVHLWSSFFQCLLPAARHQASLALCKKKLVSE